MQKDEEGKKKLTQWTRYLTVGIALTQAYTFAVFTESIPGAVPNATFWTRLAMVVVLTTGAIFVMWLGEQITERGIGNGMSLLITFSILDRLWPGLINMVGFWQAGALSFGKIVLFGAILLGVVAAVTAMSLAARRIPVQIPRKVMGRGRMTQGQKTFIPDPAHHRRRDADRLRPDDHHRSRARWPASPRTDWARALADFFTPGELPYDLTFAILILLFSYFYTSIIFNSVDLAENLKKQGGFIPGVKPGASTADYIDNVLARVTLPGALFLAADRARPGHADQEPRIPAAVRRDLGADRRRRPARHDRPDPAAPDAPQVRQLHEGGAHQVPGRQQRFM